MKSSGPSLKEIRSAAQTLAPHILHTAVVPWVGKVIERMLDPDTQVFAKLELMQFAGSFKARAALLRVMELTAEQRARGVVAASAGNHAIAVSYAAEKMGVPATVVMPESVSSIRIAKCKIRNAEVLLTGSMREALAEAERIAQVEGKILIHPFEGETTVLGTATLGLEFYEEVVPPLDAVIVSVGGGGLAAGVSSAIKQLDPCCKIYGVEPEGAASMTASLAAGTPSVLPSVQSIADSLAVPYTKPYSFSLCQQYLDEVVTVSDYQMCEALAFLFYELKLAVEPGCAAVCAALFGPLRERLLGKRVGLILCGSSIDAATFIRHLQQADAAYLKCLHGE
jgi:threonine dehydratase